MKKIFLLKVVLLIVSNGFGQNPSDVRRSYNWYFGNKAGLDFSSGSPVAITNSAMTSEEGSASISDTCGNLLFYTDGDTIWNRSNQVMQNGTGLFGCWSSTQSALIVPQPGNDSLYYVFTTDCYESQGNYGVRYSIVNMNRDGGFGEVIEKNNVLQSSTLEKIAGTFHQNEKDVWITVINRYPVGAPPDTTYNYYSYLLTENGIQVPVVSPSRIHPHKVGSGYLTFSHRGDLIVNTWPDYVDTLEIGNFNKSTGSIENLKLITLNSPDLYEASYGLSFSPNDSKLFISTRLDQDFPNWYSNVYQFDLTAFDSVSISNSKTVLMHSDTSNSNLPFYWAIQSGIDGVVYINKYNNFEPYTTYLDGIIDADSIALYTENIIDLGKEQLGSSLPNFVSNYLVSNYMNPCNNSLKENKLDRNEISVYPNPFHDYTIISFQSKNFINVKAYLFDFTGKILKEFIINEPEYLFDRQGLSSGIYFLSFNEKSQKKSIKLIIK